GQFARQQLVSPALLLFRLQTFFLDGCERRRQDVRRRRAVAAFASPVEIRRRAIEREDQRGFFNSTGWVAVIFFGEYGSFELFLGRAFPQEIDFQFGGLLLCLLQQLRWLGAVELEQYECVLDLAAFACLGFH